MEIPIEEPLGYAGVALLLAGFFLISAGLGIIRVEKISVHRGGKTCVFGFILAAFGIALLVPSILDAIVPTTPTLAPTLTIAPTSAPTDTPTPTSTSTPTAIPTNTSTSTPTDTPTISPTPVVSLEQAIRDYYSLIAQKQYVVAWEMAHEFRIAGDVISFDEFVNEWGKSGAAVISSIDIAQSGNEATVTLTLYYPEKNVYHTIRYELVRDVRLGYQRFDYWLLVRGTLLD